MRFSRNAFFCPKMTELIACLCEGEATRKHVAKLIEGESWDKVFLITDNEDKKDFLKKEGIDFVIIRQELFLPDLIEDIKNKLRDKVVGPEVGLNLVSGNGKMHMAVLSALLKLGLGIRLVALTKEGVREV